MIFNHASFPDYLIYELLKLLVFIFYLADVETSLPQNVGNKWNMFSESRSDFLSQHSLVKFYFVKISIIKADGARLFTMKINLLLNISILQYTFDMYLTCFTLFKAILS